MTDNQNRLVLQNIFQWYTQQVTTLWWTCNKISIDCDLYINSAVLRNSTAQLQDISLIKYCHKFSSVHYAVNNTFTDLVKCRSPTNFPLRLADCDFVSRSPCNSIITISGTLPPFSDLQKYIIWQQEALFWKMLGPFATASRLTPTHQVSLPVLSRAACASMSTTTMTTTTTTTTTRHRGDHYGPMEWAQLV